jgi:hypothetical protein
VLVADGRQSGQPLLELLQVVAHLQQHVSTLGRKMFIKISTLLNIVITKMRIYKGMTESRNGFGTEPPILF